MPNQSLISSPGGKSPMDQVPGLRQFVMLLAIAAAVAAGFWAVLWMQEEHYSVLFSNLGERDAASIVQVLEEARIPNRYQAGSGAVFVPADEVHSARLLLASQDMPAAGGVGFEMFEDGNGLSDSQFIESARYQRAQEVELQRTIASLRAVRAARVHLAVPRPTVFVRDRKPASASVFLSLHGGRMIQPAQVNSIVNLVASSVPDMEAAQVTVVDESGNLLSSMPDKAEENPLSQIEQRTQRLEDRYRERIEALLTPLVGRGRVQAQVSVNLNQEMIEETREIFDNENQVIRSEQISERIGNSELARGIPGALSNQPPMTPADVQAGEADDGNQPAASEPDVPVQSEALRNFEIGRTLQHIQQPMGEIRRISAAVVVDQKRLTNDEGEVELTPYAEEELARMTDLVRQAIGFSEERDDRISVINAAFQVLQEDPAIEFTEPGLLERMDWGGLLRMAAISILLLLLIFGVIRPTLRQLVMTLPPRTMELPQAFQQQLADESASGEPSRRLASGPDRKVEENPYDHKLNSAKQIVNQDPKRVAQVVRQWVNDDGG